jgi:IS30 family transposase
MRCYSHLSDDEREQIGLLKALGQSIGVIAKSIRRPKSTVLRELSRNKLPMPAIRIAGMCQSFHRFGRC